MEIRGRCGCGGVTFSVTGSPLHQLICHCRSCQIAHAAPMVAGALFAADQVACAGELVQVTVTQGPEATRRLVCPRCATKVFNVFHPSGRTVFPSLCADASWFRPQMHIQWQDRVLDVSDALPKYLDFPERFGGSGKLA